MRKEAGALALRPGGAIIPPARWRIVERAVAYEVIGSHLCSVPVRVDGRTDARFLFDTGIGVTVLSLRLLERLARRPSGRAFTGRRMSGQSVEVPLYELDALECAGARWPSPVVGGLDFGSFGPVADRIDGILSLGCFERTGVTLDPGARTLSAAVRPPDASAAEGVAVEAVRDGPSISLFAPLVLPDGSRIRVEVDTGSDSLILDSKRMETLGLRPERGEVTTREGTDETGHRYVRHAARLTGPIFLDGAPSRSQTDPPVIFQSIIYDGLVGYDFFRRFVTSIDLGRAQLTLARAGTP